MKITFLFFKNKQPWQWPSCKRPKTLSFREAANNVDRVFSSSSDYATNTTTTFSDDDDSSSLEMIVRGVRMSDSERLFLEPGYTTSSIVKGEIMASNNKELEATNITIDGDSVAVVAMESDDPYLDFKKSMTEMVENHGLMKDWDSLEELLGWYLWMNSSNNHAFIVAAFLDLLGTNSSSSSASSIAVCCSDSKSCSSADSCFSSPSSSPFSHVGVDEGDAISTSYD